MSSGGGLRHVPRAPPSLRSPSSCTYPTSVGSSSSSSSSSSITAKATSVLGTARYPRRPDQVADNFTLPAASSTPAPEPEVNPEPLSDPDVADDACSSAAEVGGDVVALELEISPTATARPAAFWVMVRVAVLSATLAVVIAADVAFAVHLLARRGITTT